MHGDNAEESGCVKRIKRRFALILAMAAGVLALASPAGAKDNSTNTASDLALAEKEACSRNLKAIYDAIEAYRTDHNKEVPNWLSDLVPQYLNDAGLLICPVSRRTGRTEVPLLADPNISSSYLYEFCPVPLGNMAPNSPKSTRRDWKRRQMDLVGPIVPIVRCRNHNGALNLAFDGRIYDSPSSWETLLTNRIPLADLSAGKLFGGSSPSSNFGATSPPSSNSAARTPKAAMNVAEKNNSFGLFPKRDAEAKKQLLDLSAFYNASLSDSWHGGTENDLSALPAGLQKLGGVEFDVRGIVQLRSKSPSSAKFPPSIRGVKVNQKCQHLYFLHASAFGSVGDEGKQIGAYVVHFVPNQMRLDIPIRYGREVRNWHALIGEPKPARELNPVWKGANEVTKRTNSSIRLFMTTWTNLAPAVEIKSIDFLASTNIPAPFLIGITVD
ncbi:MAG: hypothetical protein QOJ40_661 [Verrucomicrobiota bacterium]